MKGAAIALFAPAVLAACGGSGFSRTSVGNPLLPAGTFVRAAPPAPTIKGLQKIKHVVIIMQENRSFDNLFHGFPGADTVSTGLINLSGVTKKTKLVPVSLTAAYDIDHQRFNNFEACDGNPPGQNCKMDGFNLEDYGGNTKGLKYPQYGYVPAKETKPYFEMGEQYVVGDRMFTSHVDASFVSHQYMIAGYAQHSVNLPSGNWGCGGGDEDFVQTIDPKTGDYGAPQHPCFTYTTMADELNQAGLTWRFYASGPTDIGYIWSAYQAIDGIFYGSQWSTNVVNPSSQILSDVKSGSLATVTWVTPGWLRSDHGGSGGKGGPAWVASVVNAIGKSRFWDSTAIFVMWDEWGGWYDHVAPPHLDYDGLGFRVPLIIVSPYAKKGFVSHTTFEHGSILRFIEDDFGLAQMAASDARANDPAADCFTFGRAPRRFQPIKGAGRISDFSADATWMGPAMPD